MKNIQIAICGSAKEGLPKEHLQKAYELGLELGKRKIRIITGATTGYTYQVAKGAKESGSFIVGVSPATNKKEHVEVYKKPLDVFDTIIYTGFGFKGRNVILVRSADMVIFVGGGTGTLNEFTIAYDEGKPMGFLKGIPGVVDIYQSCIKLTHKKSPKIVVESKTSSLVSKLLNSL